MGYKFDTLTWNKRIATKTGNRKYQVADIRIEDPSLLTEVYDVETNTSTFTGESTVYEGPARIIGVRWGVQPGGESQANATTITAIRIQIPNDTGFEDEGYGEIDYGEEPYGGNLGLFPRVNRGCKVFVAASPENPVLTRYIFAITSDMQGSSAATRTFEAALDGDVSL